jgi:hypothetical protein
MKRVIQLAIGGLGGFAIAAVILALLLPFLIRRGYLAIGSPTGFWIIAAVVLLCVIVVAFRPWRSRRG